MPLTIGSARRAKIPIGKVLMPLAFASILSGGITLISTSTNVVVSGELPKYGLEPIGFFEMAPVGLVITVVGMLYLLLIAPRLIPDRVGTDVIETYNLRKSAFNAFHSVKPSSAPRPQLPRSKTMKPSPAGWPRISSALFYDDAAKAIDWLCRAFGFEVRLKVEGKGGRIQHSELTFGDGLIMAASAGGESGRPVPLPCKSPRSLGGANTQSLCVYVDDADAHCKAARAAGAKIVEEPKTTDYGEEYWADRGYRAEDLEGHQWFFVQRVREQKARAK